MSLDYESPRFTFRQAALSADFPLNTLRSYYQRELFKPPANVSEGRGKTRYLSLGDILILAIAARLIDIGMNPFRAFHVARPFVEDTYASDDVRPRLPYELFDRAEYETVLVWDGESPARVIPVPLTNDNLTLPLSRLPHDVLDYGTGLVVMPLSGLEKTVFTRLGIASELADY